MKEVIIKVAQSKKNKYGVRKYAWVPSETDKNTNYMVSKLRKRDGKHYKYACNCMHHMNTQKRCKHIQQFIAVEQSMGVKGAL